MKITTIKVGSLQTNCYILSDEASGEAVVIDPGDEARKLLAAVQGLKVLYIVLTHGHPDHFGAIDELKKKTGAQLLGHPADNWFLKQDQEIKEGDTISFGQEKLKVYHTPGHSQGSICLYTPGHLFSGDTLFYSDHGRTDLPGGSGDEMKHSLKRLAGLPAETKVYPGHEAFTTIGQERERGTLG
jgi:glyoxylase-like metal-dependent hydrolase (beta-lactamase superfamily II)